MGNVSLTDEVFSSMDLLVLLLPNALLIGSKHLFCACWHVGKLKKTKVLKRALHLYSGWVKPQGTMCSASCEICQ